MNTKDQILSSYDMSLFNGYPGNIQDMVQSLVENQKLAEYIRKNYPDAHNVTNNKALFAYVQEIKKDYMKKTAPVHKVAYDDKIECLNNALGLHQFVARQQGHQLKTKNEILISTIFKTAPADFLRMIVVHELAHLKEKDHDKNFYRLCTHMEPDYFQLEFDLKIYLLYISSIRHTSVRIELCLKGVKPKAGTITIPG